LVGASLAAQPSKWTVAPGDTSPGGFTLPQEAGAFAASSILSEFEAIAEESFLALNDDYAAITSPGDVGLLRLFDQDDEMEWLRLEGGLGELSGVFFPATGSLTDRDIQVADDAELSLRTNGDVMQFVADENGNQDLDQFQWHFEGRDLLSLTMFLLGSSGDLFVNGTYMTFGPEIAVRFLRQGPLEAGDLVRLDGGWYDRVRQADGAEDEVVVGVVSQRPGLVLGGSILSPQALEKAWGAEVVERFRQELPALREEALAEHPSLRKIDEQMASLDAYLGGRAIKPESEERVRAGYEEARRRHDDQLTLRALQAFSDRSFVSVAVGGRATVKVDASYGQITAGDYLAASPTAGVAMKARTPGSVLGTALESWTAGAGTIEVLLQRGWYGGQGADPTRLATKASDADRLADLEARVFELTAERSELLGRLAALESQWSRTGPRWGRAEGLTASPTLPVGN
jgi:hypothetical protein